jgi:hypothetical protein
MLSQLSYRPTRSDRRSSPAETSNASMVGLGRVELPTSPLSGARSSQLSYRPTVITSASIIWASASSYVASLPSHIVSSWDHSLPDRTCQRTSARRARRSQSRIVVRAKDPIRRRTSVLPASSPTPKQAMIRLTCEWPRAEALGSTR